MAVQDPISNFLTILRNAYSSKKDKITLSSSKLLESICLILKTENYIQDFKVVDEKGKKILRVHLKYKGQTPAVKFLGRVSKPGLRKYVSSKEIPITLGGMGMSVLSTSKGLISDKTARDSKIGGELLFRIW